MSAARTFTSGLAASVCSGACSRMWLPAATEASFAMTGPPMLAHVPAKNVRHSNTLCRGRLLADQHAQRLRDQGGLRLAFDLQRAVELEQHAPSALGFRCSK